MSKSIVATLAFACVLSTTQTFAAKPVSGTTDAKIASGLRTLTESRGAARLARGEWTLVRPTGGLYHVMVKSYRTGVDLSSVITATGACIERSAVDLGMFTCRATLAEVRAIAAITGVRLVSPVIPPVVNVGSVMTEGDAMHLSDQVRNLGYDGTGVHIGVISDDVDNLATVQGMGELPPDVHVIQTNPDEPGECSDGTGDEGTAMLEIVHDVAPGATLWFASGSNSSLDMRDQIIALADSGCTVICDDIGWYGEPWFEDGPIAKAVDSVSSRGVVYASAAGNAAGDVHTATYVSADGSGSGWHAWDGVADSAFAVTTYPDVCYPVVAFVQWQDPFTESGNDYDLHIYADEALTDLLYASEDLQDGSGEPFEVAGYENDTGSMRTVYVALKLHDGVAKPFKVVFRGAGSMEYSTPGREIFANQTSASGLSVAAVHPGNLSEVAYYSSHGPIEIAFPTPETRNKPDLAGAAGVSVTGVNFNTPFYGTSAAAPHVAAVAALVRQAHPGWSGEKVKTVLKETATDMYAPGWDAASGYGLVNALAAVSVELAGTVPRIVTTTTWTTAGSPYVVSDTMTVPAAEVLTIEAGVVVTIAEGIPIIIEGGLRVNGSPGLPVRFSGEGWAGLRFHQADSSSLFYTVLTGGVADTSAGQPWYYGGAIYATDTRLLVDHCTFVGNTARSGGAIFGETGSWLTITNSLFTGNRAVVRNGGAIAVEDGVFTVAKGQFCDNSAEINGGAIAVSSATASLDETMFGGNTADGDGGAALFYGGDVSISGCEFSGNHSGRFGGGAMFLFPDVRIESSSFLRNSASGNGGGFGVYAAEVDMEHCLIRQNTGTQGGGLYVESASVNLTRCTVIGNQTPGGDGAIRLYDGGLFVTTTILRDNLPKPFDGVGDTDIHIRYSSISGGYEGTGNVDIAPVYVDSANGDFTLSRWSGLINRGDPDLPPDPDGTRADMGAFAATVPDLMLTVSDVKGDQGGVVTLNWRASDVDHDVSRLTHYSIWRALPSGATKRAGGVYRISKTAIDELAWEKLADQPAHRLTYYAFTASTLRDSVAGDMAVHGFMVSAQTNLPDVFFDALPAEGYSVDNLAPPPPVMRPAQPIADRISLGWSKSEAPDLLRYLVYRGTSEIVNPAVDSLVTMTEDTVFIDASPPEEVAWYIVLAEDIHGNLSKPSNQVMVDPTGVGAIVPREYALHPNVPNPFNPVTTIRFDLPEVVHVRIVIYNLPGQRVRTLVNGERTAGVHTAVWNGTDAIGRRAASGIYWYRMTAGDRVFVRRMTLSR
jgi:predicted outer membrane repeat protein